MDTVAQALLEEVERLLEAELACLLIVDDERGEATGVTGRVLGRELEWFHEVRIDLAAESSGVASAVSGAAPFSVYDARTSNAPELRCASRELSNDPPAGFSEELGVKLADGSARWLLSWVATYRDNEVVTVRCSVHPCDTSVGKPLH